MLDQFRSYWKTDDLQSDLSEMYVLYHYIHTYTPLYRPLQSLSVDPGPVSRETTPDLIHPNSETHFLSEVDLHHMPSEPVSLHFQNLKFSELKFCSAVCV